MPHESGLHYLDLKDNEDAAVALFMMIRENFEGYIKKQLEEGGAPRHIVSKQCLEISQEKTMRSWYMLILLPIVQ